MNILLTNDDGIYAEGLWALHRRLSPDYTVSVIAPDRERSAVGHGITLHTPLRANRITVNGNGEGIAVNGTPADCIKLGILELLDDRPDLVISGINPGANIGININYSGTVSAAREAALFGLPAIAVSIEGPKTDHLDDAAAFIAKLAKDVVKRGLPFGTLLNVNFPNLPLVAVAGVRVSRQSVSLASEYFEKRNDPRNRTYYWSGYDMNSSFEHPDTDGAVLKEKYISITPIKCDMTDYGMVKDIKSLKFEVGSLKFEVS